MTAPPSAPPSAPRPLVAVASLIALGVALFGRFLSLPFTTSDIFPLVAAHRATDVASLWHSLQQRLMDGFFSARFYRPVTQFSYALDSFLWGIDPIGFHLAQLLVHLWATLALYALARQVLPDRPRAALLAPLLFLTFAGHLDIVPGLDRRADMLMGAALVSSLACMRRAVTPGSTPRAPATLRLLPWLAASLLAVLALASKEPGIAALVLLPVVVLTADGAGSTDSRPMGSRLRRALLLTLPAIVLDLGFMAVRHQVLGAWGGGYGRTLSLPLFGQYVGDLLSDYGPPELLRAPGQVLPDLLALAALVASLLLGALQLRRSEGSIQHRNVVFLVIVWIGAFGAIYGLMASYAPWHLYAPAAGYALGVAAILDRVWMTAWKTEKRQKMARALVILTLLGWAGRTRDLFLDRSWEDGARATQQAIDGTLEQLQAVPDRSLLYLAAYPGRVPYSRARRHLARWNSGLYDYAMAGALALYDPGRTYRLASIAYLWLEDPARYTAEGRLVGHQYTVEVRAGGALVLPWSGRTKGNTLQNRRFTTTVLNPQTARIELTPGHDQPDRFVLLYAGDGEVRMEEVP